MANGTNDTTNNSMATFRGEVVFDHVASGCVWSGDAYASTRNASQTSGVVYISGVRLTVAAVSARLFTASVDTYIDVNGSGVQVYTEVSNNAASPALTAGNIRIGIIITGATTIAAATSVNQGQESRVLPIASTIAYSVTDSLGNLICPRDPNRKVLGYRQITTQPTTTSATDANITGLQVPVIVPVNRKVIIVVETNIQNGVVNAANNISIWDGSAPGGTKLHASISEVAQINGQLQLHIEVETTPAATSKTYNAGFSVGTNTLTLNNVSGAVAYIRVLLG